MRSTAARDLAFLPRRELKHAGGQDHHGRSEWREMRQHRYAPLGRRHDDAHRIHRHADHHPHREVSDCHQRRQPRQMRHRSRANLPPISPQHGKQRRCHHHQHHHDPHAEERHRRAEPRLAWHPHPHHGHHPSTRDLPCRVLVVTPPPHSLFVPAQRRTIEPLVHGPESVQSARVGGVCVINDAILEYERAQARPLAQVRVHVHAAHRPKIRRRVRGRPCGDPGPTIGRGAREWPGRFAPVIVLDANDLLLLFGIGRIEVRVELAPERRRPREPPAHPLFVLPQLRERCLRHRPEHHIVIFQMHGDAIEAVGNGRARWTPRRVGRTKHEMVHEQLRSSLKQIRQSDTSLIGLEMVRGVDPDPWQLLPPFRQLIALPCMRLLGLQQIQPGGQPFFTRSNGVRCRHRSILGLVARRPRFCVGSDVLVGGLL